MASLSSDYQAGSWMARLLAFAFCFLATSIVWQKPAGSQREARSAAGSVVEAATVPTELGSWKGTAIEVSHRAIEILETPDVALMEYRLGKEPPLWFARVSGFGNRAAFHPPELCYVGSHFEVLERGPITVFVKGQQRRLMRLVIGQGSERFEAWYWFTANGQITPSYYRQQAWLLFDALRRKPASGTLVRISTPLDDAQHAHRRLLAFLVSWDAAGQNRDHHDL